MTSDSFPTELTMEILSRLPPKSIARFHCVSKQWESMFGHAYFRELFQTRSSAKSLILFAIEKEGLWSFFSVPQRHPSYDKSSSSSSLVVATEFHMKFPPENMRIQRRASEFAFGYASGLMYFYDMRTDRNELPVICNPKTGRYTTLPHMLFRYRYIHACSFFGFDPIGKQFKVLSIEYPFRRNHNKILTLGTGDRTWRKIKCPLKHEKVSEGICINGVLYYLGDTSDEEMTDSSDERMTEFVIVCFDVRSEEFKFIYPEGNCQLINYMGKLGVIHYDSVDDAIELLVWVLEDTKKQEWSKHEYTLKDDKFLPYHVLVVGVTGTGEIVLSMLDYTSEEPFYVFYLNPERKSLQRVEIKGFGEYHEAFDRPSRVHVFVDDGSSFYAFANQEEDLNVNDTKLLKSSIYGPYVKTEVDRYDSDYSGEEYYSEGEDSDAFVEGGEEYDYDYGYDYEYEAEYDYSVW